MSVCPNRGIQVPLALGTYLVLASACVAPRTVEGSPPRLRVAAEWEPALGAMVRWPPYLPHRLLAAIAENSHLFVLAEDAAAATDARAWFEAWGVDPERYEFLSVPGSDDAAWPRDFGPHPIFTVAEGSNSAMRATTSRRRTAICPAMHRS